MTEKNVDCQENKASNKQNYLELLSSRNSHLLYLNSFLASGNFCFLLITFVPERIFLKIQQATTKAWKITQQSKELSQSTYQWHWSDWADAQAGLCLLFRCGKTNRFSRVRAYMLNKKNANVTSYIPRTWYIKYLTNKEHLNYLQGSHNVATDNNFQISYFF